MDKHQFEAVLQHCGSPHHDSTMVGKTTHPQTKQLLGVMYKSIQTKCVFVVQMDNTSNNHIIAAHVWYFTIDYTACHIVWHYVSFPAAALPLCLSPSSASSRTTTSTDASSASCCLWGPPSTWTAPHSTRPWQPSSSPK